jgi:hypothetical protein
MYRQKYGVHFTVFRGSLFGLQVGSRKPTEESHLYSTCIAKASVELLQLTQLTDTKAQSQILSCSDVADRYKKNSDEVTVLAEI